MDDLLGPTWLESYAYGERMYVPGFVSLCPGCSLCQWHGLPHYVFEVLEGPGIHSLAQLAPGEYQLRVVQT